MTEYIEREAAIESLPVAWDSAINALRNAPAADVAPVVHGRWIYNRDNYPAFLVCDQCNTVWYRDTNYCPNCGARMDGGADND